MILLKRRELVFRLPITRGTWVFIDRRDRDRHRDRERQRESEGELG